MGSTNVMIDLETLGTTADAAILSIGAVKFELESGTIEDDGFYASVSLDSNSEYKRRIQEDTLIWWLKQPVEAQSVFHESKQTLPTALAELVEWMGDAEHQMWSNGADFDLPMLTHAFVQCGLEVPWKHWNSRCFRTYKNLPGAKAVKIPFEGTKHNALFDAVHQAKTVQAIHTKLFADNHVFKVKTS